MRVEPNTCLGGMWGTVRVEPRTSLPDRISANSWLGFSGVLARGVPAVAVGSYRCAHALSDLRGVAIESS